MKQRLLDNSLEVFVAAVAALTLVRLLFLPQLSTTRNLVNAFALAAVLHELEEKRFPGGFYEMVQQLLGLDTGRMNVGLSSFAVMAYWCIILTLAFVFDGCLPLFVMLVALGIFEMLAHTLVPIIGRLGRPYSPGMASAWCMGALSVYSIVQLAAAGLGCWWEYLLGTVLMFVGFALMQRASLADSGMSYRELVGRIRALARR